MMRKWGNFLPSLVPVRNFDLDNSIDYLDFWDPDRFWGVLRENEETGELESIQGWELKLEAYARAHKRGCEEYWDNWFFGRDRALSSG